MPAVRVLLAPDAFAGALTAVQAAEAMAAGWARRTADDEAAQACGLHLVPEDRRDPGTVTSAGVGELVRSAVDAGADRVVVATGGAACHDGGAGPLAQL